jgi:hypothetical protein
MSDSDQLKPETPPAEPEQTEDESIIDLVEEIEEPLSPDSLAPLEQPLLGSGDASEAAEAFSPELADLGKLEFEEDEDQPADEEGPATEDREALLPETMDWLLEPEADASTEGGVDRRGAPIVKIMEATEFNEPLPETEEILQAMAPAPTGSDSAAEDDDLELIEIEDDEADDELIVFDDLDLDEASPPVESTAEAAAPAAPPVDFDADLFEDTSAADVFAANVASGLAAADNASAPPSPPATEVPPIAPLASLPPAPPVQASTGETPPRAESLALSAEQIDAAVERILERRLGASLEAIVLRAVETAVSNEIQRLKALLLEEDPYDRTP